MKCQEFIHAAECLTPSQLSSLRADDAELLAHARECAACGRWLESQCLLGNAMQALRLSTARRAAGPGVEQAVLRAFRNHEFAPPSPAAPDRAAPVVWRLSRLFEFGAYAAVAAALILAAFLGSRLLHDRHASQPPTQAQMVVAPHSGPSPAPKSAVSSDASGSMSSEVASKAEKTKKRTARAAAPPVETGTAAAAEAASDSDGYVALMLCDPLICSGDEEVIRMELPAVGATSAEGDSGQPVLADVVIGDDGLVRAMRIVQ